MALGTRLFSSSLVELELADLLIMFLTNFLGYLLSTNNLVTFRRDSCREVGSGEQAIARLVSPMRIARLDVIPRCNTETVNWLYIKSC
jgi:hypothetical protein